jgi:hypothetical protein
MTMLRKDAIKYKLIERLSYCIEPRFKPGEWLVEVEENKSALGEGLGFCTATVIWKGFETMEVTTAIEFLYEKIVHPVFTVDERQRITFCAGRPSEYDMWEV